MITWLASYPRSGNTMLRMTLYQQFGIPSCTAGKAKMFSKRPEMAEMVGHIDRPAPIPQMAAAEEMYFVKTHFLPSDESPAIYLIRNGCDASVSYAHHIVDFSPEEVKLGLTDILNARIRQTPFHRALRRVIVGRITFGGWARHVMAWTNRSATTCIIRYEDLIKDPVSVTLEAARSTGWPVQIEKGKPLPTFDELHAKWPDFFRAGKVGNGKEEMPRQLYDLFWKEQGHVMQKLGWTKE